MRSLPDLAPRPDGHTLPLLFVERAVAMAEQDAKAASTPTLYGYPQTNAQLIASLNLQPHDEGGWYAVMHVSSQQIETPFAAIRQTDDKDQASSSSLRPVQSTIYYLLGMGQPPDPSVRHHRSAIGYMHRNRSETMHLLHCGRVEYTLISTVSRPPQIRTVVMGEDADNGEVRQLMVDQHEWKVSEVPLADREWAEKQGEAAQDRVGGLISEVVTPGFDWQDHVYLTMEALQDLFGDDQANIQRFQRYVLPA